MVGKYLPARAIVLQVPTGQLNINLIRCDMRDPSWKSEVYL